MKSWKAVVLWAASTSEQLPKQGLQELWKCRRRWCYGQLPSSLRWVAVCEELANGGHLPSSFSTEGSSFPLSVSFGTQFGPHLGAAPCTSDFIAPPPPGAWRRGGALSCLAEALCCRPLRPTPLPRQ